MKGNRCGIQGNTNKNKVGFNPVKSDIIKGNRSGFLDGKNNPGQKEKTAD